MENHALEKFLDRKIVNNQELSNIIKLQSSIDEYLDIKISEMF